MRTLSVFALLCLAGCESATLEVGEPGQTLTDPTTVPGTLPTLPCLAAVDSVSPDPGGMANIDDPVVITLTEAIDASQMPLLSLYVSDTQEPVGTTVELSSDGLQATFTADAPLAYDTQYTMDVTVCDMNISGTFTTFPEPINGDDLVGRAYVLPFADLVWTEPSNATLLSSMIGIDALLVQVLAHDAVLAELDAVAATGIFSGADVLPDCPAATQTPPADFSGNPVVEVGPENLSLQGVVIEDFYLAGAFNTDATAMEDVRIRGRIDTRSFGFSPCGFIDCVPCPDGVVECLTVLAVADRADWQEGLLVDPALYAPDDPSWDDFSIWRPLREKQVREEDDDPVKGAMTLFRIKQRSDLGDDASHTEAGTDSRNHEEVR